MGVMLGMLLEQEPFVEVLYRKKYHTCNILILKYRLSVDASTSGKWVSSQYAFNANPITTICLRWRLHTNHLLGSIMTSKCLKVKGSLSLSAIILIPMEETNFFTRLKPNILRLCPSLPRPLRWRHHIWLAFTTWYWRCLCVAGDLYVEMHQYARMVVILCLREKISDTKSFCPQTQRNLDTETVGRS